MDGDGGRMSDLIAPADTKPIALRQSRQIEIQDESIRISTQICYQRHDGPATSFPDQVNTSTLGHPSAGSPTQQNGKRKIQALDLRRRNPKTLYEVIKLQSGTMEARTWWLQRNAGSDETLNSQTPWTPAHIQI